MFLIFFLLSIYRCEENSFRCLFFYSCYLLAPQLYRLCTMVSCSGIHVPCLRHLTWLMCLPRDLCTEQQSEQINTPLFTEAQLGELEPQSAQMERGWRGLDLLNMVEVGYSLMGSIFNHYNCCLKQLSKVKRSKLTPLVIS